jgi:hypothetical protein
MAELITPLSNVLFRYLAVQVINEHTALIADGQFLIFAVFDVLFILTEQNQLGVTAFSKQLS